MSSELFINGKVWQANGSFIESFGIKKKHIIFTGSNADAALIQNDYEKVTDLQNKLVLPGLIDGHLHLVYGSLMRKRLDCSNVKDTADLKIIVNDYVKSNPGLKWIIGSNLNINKVLIPNNDGGNIPDGLIRDIPLFITNYDYHSCICNSAAIEKTGFKPESFSDDEVQIDSNGTPIGILKEKAMNYIFDNLPGPDIDEMVKAVEEMLEILHSFGITSVSDITEIEDLEVYKKLYDTGKLKIRINSYIPFKEFPNLKKYEDYIKEINPDLFTIIGFKAFYDGALGSETALFSENYKDKAHNGYKTEMVTSGEVFRLAKEIDNAGKQIIIHAIGDKAVSEVLDICEMLNKENGKRERRFRIEHSQHINEKDFTRFKELNVIASVQPVHLKYDASTVKEKLSDYLINHTHNYKELIDIGVSVNFGTDFPIVEINPYENIRMAVTRRTVNGVFTPSYKISLQDCIKGYTINNAYANFNENAVGSIEKGKVADFVIMEDDIFEIDEDKIGSAKVYKTYFSGVEIPEPSGKA